MQKQTMSVMKQTKGQGTPGPWQVSCGMVETVARMRGDAGPMEQGVPIAYMAREYTTPTAPTERDQNACIIAQAPKGVELARLVIEYYDANKGTWANEHPTDLVKLARSIIARVDGGDK